MKKFERKFLWCAFVAYLSAPTIAHSSPWTYDDEPLWLGSSVKHNLMFALDDSGSMDSEVLFDNNDGAIYIASDGYFADSSGNLNSSGKKYVYLFPNDADSGYDGKRLYSNSSGHYAIPPIPQYAFARSPDYNKAYYNPNESYLPWPSFGGETFDETDASTETEFFYERYTGFSSAKIKLFDDVPAGTGDEAFYIADDDMVCDADGATCATGDVGFQYYPATYYLKQDSGTFYYNSPFDSSDSVLFEAEKQTHSSPMLSGTTLEKFVSVSAFPDEQAGYKDALGAASNGDFVGTLYSQGDSLGSVPTEDGITMDFKVPDTLKTGPYKIWMRIYSQGDAHDSFYVRLRDPEPGNPFKNTLLSTPENAFLSGDTDGDWKRVRDSVYADDEWIWVEWGEVQFANTLATQTIDVKWREGGTYIDQIMVTGNTSDTPVEIAFLDGVTLNCVSDTSAELYQYYAKNPSRFQVSSADTSRIDGLAYDGSCLKKYTIPNSDSDSFDNGTGNGRSTADERQNFVNWFEFHRRRHQAMRGAVASSMAGLNDVRAGLFWINSQRTVVMRDWSVASEVSTFLADHYGHVKSGGTPLRTALDHAGSEYARHTEVDDGAGNKTITSPIISECQKNYTLLFTDGYNSQGPRLDTKGTTDTSDDEIIPPVTGIDNADDGAGTPYEDSYPYTLADIAYKYYDNLSHGGSFASGSVRAPLACDGSPDPWLDCKTDLHMTTYTVGLGTTGTIFGVTHNSVEEAHNNPPTWPDVNSGTRNPEQVDDLFHAAVNGRGQIYNASSSAELATAMDEAMSDIVASIGSGSGVTFNSSSLQANDGTSIYTTLFNSTDWSGNVTARALDGGTGAVLGSVWKDSNGDDAGAAEILDERDLSADPRLILTMGATDGVAFTWDNLQDFQKNDLLFPEDTGTASAADEAFAKERLEWVKGKMTNTTLRNRGSRLGDIVHSAPVYVGVPASPWPDAAPFGFEGTHPKYEDRNRYSDFQNRDKSDTVGQVNSNGKGGAADRDPVIYVGANDGMLHGFNGSNNATDGGKELLAYIPNDVYSSSSGEGLHYLTDPDYVHKYYVDQSPVVQDIFSYGSASELSVNGGDAYRDWRTLLVGGMRGGGTGLFALDVTYPDEFSEANAADTVFWEFTESNATGAAANLGYRTEPPVIAMMPNEKWAVIFGNGYQSTNERAVLFIVYIEEGLDGTWTLNDDYVMIDTSVYGGQTTGNGLSGVAVADTDGDYIADRIYAGDLKGDMWAFDVSSTTASSWTASKLFTTKDSAISTDTPQPILAAPGLAFNTDQVTSTNAPNILVTFGTGKYLEGSDTSDLSVQSYYTVWDRGDTNLYREDLTERNLTQSGTKLSLSGQTDANGDVISPWNASGSTRGWFFDFNTGTPAGERLINKPLLAPDKDLGPVAIFASLIPDESECAGGGSSVLYALPLLTGLNPTKPIADLDGDGKIDSNDQGVGVTKDDLINDPNRLGQYLYGSKGDGTDVDVTETTIDSAGEREGRLGWFELIDD